MNKQRLVLDANVIVSAFLFKNSKPRQTLEIAKNNNTILLSDSIINELKNVLYRRKFDRYISITTRE